MVIYVQPASGPPLWLTTLLALLSALIATVVTAWVARTREHQKWVWEKRVALYREIYNFLRKRQPLNMVTGDPLHFRSAASEKGFYTDLSFTGTQQTEREFLEYTAFLEKNSEEIVKQAIATRRQQVDGVDLDVFLAAQNSNFELQAMLPQRGSSASPDLHGSGGPEASSVRRQDDGPVPRDEPSHDQAGRWLFWPVAVGAQRLARLLVGPQRVTPAADSTQVFQSVVVPVVDVIDLSGLAGALRAVDPAPVVVAQQHLRPEPLPVRR